MNNFLTQDSTFIEPKYPHYYFISLYLRNRRPRPLHFVLRTSGTVADYCFCNFFWVIEKIRTVGWLVDARKFPQRGIAIFHVSQAKCTSVNCPWGAFLQRLMIIIRIRKITVILIVVIIILIIVILIILIITIITAIVSPLRRPCITPSGVHMSPLLAYFIIYYLL